MNLQFSQKDFNNASVANIASKYCALQVEYAAYISDNSTIKTPGSTAEYQAYLKVLSDTLASMGSQAYCKPTGEPSEKSVAINPQTIATTICEITKLLSTYAIFFNSTYDKLALQNISNVLIAELAKLGYTFNSTSCMAVKSNTTISPAHPGPSASPAPSTPPTFTPPTTTPAPGQTGPVVINTFKLAPFNPNMTGVIGALMIAGAVAWMMAAWRASHKIGKNFILPAVLLLWGIIKVAKYVSIKTVYKK